MVVIGKEEIYNLKLLNHLLTRQELTDFVELFRRNTSARVTINGSVRIDYYQDFYKDGYLSEKDLRYSFEIDRSTNINKTFCIFLNKQIIKRILKCLNDKEFNSLLRNSKEVHLTNEREGCFFTFVKKNGIKVDYSPPKKKLKLNWVTTQKRKEAIAAEGR